MKKLSLEYVKEEYRKKGYELLTNKWQGNSVPMLVTKDGYYYIQSYSNFQQNKFPNEFGFRNPYAEQNIENYIKKRFKESTEIIEIKKIRKSKRDRFLLTLKCANCGKIYTQTFDDITKKSKTHLLCNNCNKIIRGRNHRKDKNEVIETFKIHGYTLFPNQEITRNDCLKVVDKDGYIGYTSYNSIIRGKNMSPFEYHSNKSNYIYNINNWCRLNGIKSKALRFNNEKNFKRVGIEFQCECGNHFVTTKNSFCYGKCRCDDCSKRLSRYEYLIKTYLEQKGIAFIYQYNINSCRDVLPLPFDFQLKDYNALIEVDGEGHEKPCNFNQISYQQAIISYLSTVKHDKIKTEYCDKYNIPLLHISYKDINNSSNYKKIIDDFISKL